MCDVMVLHAALTGRLEAVRDAALLDRLPYAYRLGLEQRDARARSASLLALRLLAEGVLRQRGSALDVAQLRFPAGGKPSLDGGPWFSISHSATRVAVAVSGHCDLGIDLEDLGAPGRDQVALARWTAIEATLKAVGAGLRQSGEVSLSPDQATAQLAGAQVCTRPLLLAPGCVATLATREPVRRVVVEEREQADGG
jgi:phosphopantetheinyl transferase